MTTTVSAPEGYTLGDGSTAAQVAGARWARWRWLILVSLLVLVSVTVLALAEPAASTRDLSIDNHRPNGARAAAEVLRERGITVQEVDTLQEAYIQLASSGTLVIADYAFFTDEQIETIQAHEGELVWVDPNANELQELGPELSRAVAPEGNTAQAGCDVPAAERAEQLSDVRGRLVLPEPEEGVTVCFSNDDGFSGATVHLDRPGQGTEHIVADRAIFSNAALANDGNAALTFNLVGSHPTLVWYVGNPADETLFGDEQPGASYFAPTTPRWLAPLVVSLAITGFVAAFWRGRRMGALITEPLPVIVRASEATRGRARLYRRGGAHGHATAAMRAAAAGRMAARLGVPRSSEPTAVVSAIAGATGRDGPQIQQALYGPAPSTDQQMLDLVTLLDALESEVAQS